MFTFVVTLLLGAITLFTISLQKTYSHLPPKELKRRVRAKDPIATMLFRAVSYGLSLRLLLWMIIGLSASCFFVILARSMATWLALIGCASIIWFGFAWMPNARTNDVAVRLAAKVAPGLAWVLNFLHPVLDRIAQLISAHRPLTIHTGLYQKEDLVELIDQQQVQADNRITQDELQVAYHALTFNDKLISQVMIPRRIVKSVSVTEPIGPILMGELHDSSFSRFPVYQEKEENIVGTLYMRDLVSVKAGGIVRDVMKKDVFYVHEDQSLMTALQAFLKTKHHLFVVVNSFEEFVGILTIEDVLEQIIGKPIVDEFDKYDDLRAVAARHAQKDHAKQAHANNAE